MKRWTWRVLCLFSNSSTTLLPPSAISNSRFIAETQARCRCAYSRNESSGCKGSDDNKRSGSKKRSGSTCQEEKPKAGHRDVESGWGSRKSGIRGNKPVDWVLCRHYHLLPVNNRELMVSHPSAENKQKTITLTATYESLDEIRDFVSWSAQACGLIQNDIYAVQLAVDEAFTNIIEHAYGGESQEKVKCTCEIGEKGLKISLRDSGRPFNPDQVSIPDFKSSLEERPTGGLGLYFMRKLMDEVRYEFIPPPTNKDGCNLLTMVKFKRRAA